MVEVNDILRRETNLRKQLLGVKGKLFIQARYMIGRGRVVTIVSESSPIVFQYKIQLERALTSAIFNARYIVNSRYGVYEAKFIEIEEWGIKYNNRNLTIKRVNNQGKYYNYIYVKGSTGVQQVTKWSNKPAYNLDELGRDVD